MTDTELTLEEIEAISYIGLTRGLFNELKAAALRSVEPKQENVVKTGGDYSFEGVVVARFHKLNGKERVVVENSDGILHIFNPTQLSPSKQEVTNLKGDRFDTLANYLMEDVGLDGKLQGPDAANVSDKLAVILRALISPTHAYLKNDAVPMAKQMQQDIQASGALNKPH